MSSKGRKLNALEQRIHQAALAATDMVCVVFLSFLFFSFLFCFCFFSVVIVCGSWFRFLFSVFLLVCVCAGGWFCL